jgi:hypothetical protein
LPMLAACCCMAGTLYYLSDSAGVAHIDVMHVVLQAGGGAVVYLALMVWWQKQTFIRIVKGSF